MFRNVTGVQEAVVHRHSHESLGNGVVDGKHPIKIIKDLHSDEIAENYPILRQKWIDEREELIEYLKHQTQIEQIRQLENVIECFNELIEHGEVNKHCQKLINERKNISHPSIPKISIFTKKPLADKIIQLPRQLSPTTIDLTNPFRKITSEIFQSKTSTENMTNALQFYVVAEQFRQPEKSTNKHYFTSSIFE